MIIAHPGIFVSLPFKRRELEELGARFILTRDPVQIVEGIHSSGEIERITWDRAVGYRIENGRLVNDEVKDDMSLILDSGDSIAVSLGIAEYYACPKAHGQAVKVPPSDRCRAPGF